MTFHQHTSVSQGRTCPDKCTCCHTEIEVADQTFYLTQSQYTGTWPTSLSADPNAKRLAGQPLESQYLSLARLDNDKSPTVKAEVEPRPAVLKADVYPQGPRGGSLPGRNEELTISCLLASLHVLASPRWSRKRTAIPEKREEPTAESAL